MANTSSDETQVVPIKLNE